GADEGDASATGGHEEGVDPTDTDTDTDAPPDTGTDGGSDDTDDPSGDDGPPRTCAPVTSGGEPCEAPSAHMICDSGTDPFQAIGLDCPGDATNSTPILDEVFQAADATTARVITQFG